MKNQIINLFFGVIKVNIPMKIKTYKFTYWPIFKHDTKDSIVELEDPFLNIQRIISRKFHINSLKLKVESFILIIWSLI